MHEAVSLLDCDMPSPYTLGSETGVEAVIYALVRRYLLRMQILEASVHVGEEGTDGLGSHGKSLLGRRDGRTLHHRHRHSTWEGVRLAHSCEPSRMLGDFCDAGPGVASPYLLSRPRSILICTPSTSHYFLMM